MTDQGTKSDKRDNVYLPEHFEKEAEEARDRAYARYSGGKWYMGPMATSIRLAFWAGWKAGRQFEDDEKWRRMIAGLKL
ncbi:MAG: hypothetical protein ACFFCW_38470 [Candidatus Hodarchaeota archaeon]